MPYVTEGDEEKSKQVDSGVKNKWRWEWLSKTDATEGREFRIWCKKLDQPGACYCTVCYKVIKYGSSGAKSLILHAQQESHQKNVKGLSSNESIPGAEESPVQLPVSSMSERIAEQKAVLTAFAAEHALPLKLIPDLLSLSKRLAQDKRALIKTSMGTTCATYTTAHGLAAGLKEELNCKLRSAPFSLNLDEATNNAMDKVVNIVVNYYDEQRQQVMTEHFASVIVNIATADNITETYSTYLVLLLHQLIRVWSCYEYSTDQYI